MGDPNAQWVVKDESGKLRGPYTTERVIELIKTGVISGSEQIAKFPGGDFVPISSDLRFYDYLLEALEADQRDERMGHTIVRSEAETVITKAVEVQKKELDDGPLRKNEGTRSAEIVSMGSDQTQDNTAIRAMKRKQGHSQVIEATDLNKKIKQEEKKKEMKKARAPLVLIAVVMLVGVYLVFFSAPSRQGKGNLLAPRKGQPKIAKKTVTKRIYRAAKAFEKDTYKDYLTTQNILVQLLEGSPDNLNVRELLCLTYRELWPFVNQDSKDLQTVAYVSQSTMALDPAGPIGLQCRIVNLLVNGRFQEAKSVIETGLDQYPKTFILYLMHGEMKAQDRDYVQAGPWVEKMLSAWPNYVKTYIVLSNIYEKSRRPTDAAIMLRKALQLNPAHPVAKIRLGLLEKNSFDHDDVAFDLISSALANEEGVPRRILAEAYLGLSEIHLNRKNRSAALKAAQNAYSMNSNLPGAREMVIKLGGVEKLNETDVKEKELVFLGDQYARAGNCFAAQAEYKVAFENDPKNAVAALKAAECLWELSQSSEAIQWVKKAIKADKNLIKAYTTLADYHSQRFNFQEAAQTLKIAQQIAPKNYVVLRGYARLENRRRNMQGAVMWAKRSLKFYDTDVETYIILADSYVGLNDYEKAHTFAIKAKELDPNNSEAQIVYARVLAGFQGIDSAIYYLKEMVSKYRHVKEYQMGLGELYLSDERYPEAEETFIKVRALDENNKLAHLRQGQALQAQGKLEQALEAYLTAAELDPSDAEPIFHAGMLYLDYGKPAEAMQQFQRVLRINKYYPRAHFLIGKAALRMDPPDPKLALDEANQERRINPALADAYLLAAESYHLMGQFSNCAGQYQKAIRLRPQGADIYVKLATCYRKAGSLDVANSMLDVAQEKESGMPEIYKEQGAIFEMQGEQQAACRSYEQYLTLSPNARDKGDIESRMSKMGC